MKNLIAGLFAALVSLFCAAPARGCAASSSMISFAIRTINDSLLPPTSF